MFWRVDGDGEGSLSEIADYYRGLDRGRLVLLGPAGSGKTVLAVRLVRDLAATIVDTAIAPGGADASGRMLVPVRVSAPAFDPASGEPDLAEISPARLAERLDAWLAKQLVTGYGVRPKHAGALVTGGWLLGGLDGVDEMDPPDTPPRRAAALMAALNHPTTRGPRAMVLTCRTERYEQLTTTATYIGDRDVAQPATVVEVQPLTGGAAASYLRYRFPDPAGSGQG